ncbi:hypothetical protein FVE85_6280 [Porphyridium purpureum]|uniref:Uncharacterized protein n=1 Tax=Porphyridium purpureum TaxID=35688 RepID=A0A5J4Z5U3_PORPP|nr:hypothetical protein FVE85_6280 [Porphyridium purpureum]|eukprot:POR0668..scf295_1
MEAANYAVKVCRNCGRSVTWGALESEDGVFCGKDCYWSVSLADGNARTTRKTATRVTKKPLGAAATEKRREQAKASPPKASCAEAVSYEYSHAMFDLVELELLGEVRNDAAGGASSSLSRRSTQSLHRPSGCIPAA